MVRGVNLTAGTLEIIRSALKADPLVTPADRAKFLAVLRYGETVGSRKGEGVRVLSRKETAVRLGRSLRFVDKLAATGVIKKVRPPGRTRSIGFVEESVHTLILSGNAPQP